MKKSDERVVLYIGLLLLGVMLVHPLQFTAAPAGMLTEDQLRALRNASITTPSPVSTNGPGPVRTPTPVVNSEQPFYWFGIPVPRWVPALGFLALIVAVLLSWITIPIFVLLSLFLTFMLALGMAISPIFAALGLVTDSIKLIRDVVENPSKTVDKVVDAITKIIDKIATALHIPPWLLVLVLLALIIYLWHRRTKGGKKG